MYICPEVGGREPTLPRLRESTGADDDAPSSGEDGGIDAPLAERRARRESDALTAGSSAAAELLGSNEPSGGEGGRSLVFIVAGCYCSRRARNS